MGKQEELLGILKKEVVPALGCTGPIAVAYVAAEAASAVGGTPIRILCKTDRHTGVKVDDVGLPKTDAVGDEMAAAMGALAGDAAAGLEVLHSVTEEDARRALDFVRSGNVVVERDLTTNVLGLWVDCTVETDRGVGRAVAVKSPANLVYKEANGTVLVHTPYDRVASMDESRDKMAGFVIGDFYAFAVNVPLRELEFLRQAVELNRELSRSVLSGEFQGVGFGTSMYARAEGDVIRRAKAVTAAASEARMLGCPKPAMSCAASGNVGISASMPLISLAQSLGAGEEKLLRSIALSYLMTICIKNRIGRISSMCACTVAASSGVASGAVYLMGGDLEAVYRAVNNTVINVFGVVCDGARAACAMKLASAVGTALETAMIAMDGVETPKSQGVCGSSADDTINFMGAFAQKGMAESDLALCRALYERRHQER